MTAENAREACLRSFLEILAERPLGRIDLAQVAAHAGVALSQLRAAYGSLDDLIAAFFRATDRKVLAEGGPDSEDFAGEGPKERLFEVLMRRLDALEPHRAAVRALGAAARRDPLLALRLLRLSEQSQRFMLAAAGIDCTGVAGAVKAKGLAVLFARLLKVWLKDEDPGLSRTMAALDQELVDAGKLLNMLDDMAFIVLPWRQRRRDAEPKAAAPEPEEAFAPAD